SGRVVGVHLLNEMIGREVLPNSALIMAGGRGSRLGELTKTLPKPLLKVAGRPVIEWILLHLVSEGIRQVYISTGYLAEEIESHLGSGTEFGCEITYLRDPEGHPLGSGGPLGLLREEDLTSPIIAMNGDLMTRFGLREMLSAHHRLGNDVTIAALTYTVDIPFGVLETDEGGLITAMSEKPSASWPVNAGIYVISPKELPSVRPERELPMTEFIQDCLDRGAQVGSWEIDGDWVDIGRPEDLDTARGQR
ncbi:MAG: sugar phosphate nucleotidyltransferase, partial [Candidatus Nanopelagicales bacterium]